MQFIDEAKIYLQSGKGGDGCTAFFHCRTKRRRIPNGGNGGKGGDVYICGNRQLNTLLELRFHPHYKSGPGGVGKPNRCAGRTGGEQKIRVPLGTKVFISQETAPLFEVLDETPKLLLSGGQGGVGNANRAMSKPGKLGSSLTLELELNLLADVGLVGLPNAGKSTLISVLSNARPRIADYPFTTLVPQLGVVRCAADQTFVMADIPGILPGAHQGKGMGLQFLRHIRRSAVLAFVIECEKDLDVLASYQALQYELECFSADLAKKPRLVVLSKIDTIKDPTLLQHFQQQFLAQGVLALPVSSLQHKGLKALVPKLFEQVQNQRIQAVAQALEI